MEYVKVTTAPLSVVDSFPGGATRSIVFSPDGQRAYMAAGRNTVVATATNTVLDTFPHGGLLVDGLALSPNGERAYAVAFDTSGSFRQGLAVDTSWIEVLDVNANIIVAHVPLFDSFRGGVNALADRNPVVTPDGAWLYHIGNDLVYRISTADYSLTPISSEGAGLLAINP